MSETMIQIRNVPREFHQRLKIRAAIEGMSMSDYVLREVGKALDRPTRAEVLSRIQRRAPSVTGPRAADLIRAAREAR